MRDETSKRRMQRAGLAVAGGVLLGAAALAQEPVKSEAVTQTGAQTQIAAVRPAETTTGGMRKTTNVAPGSPEAKLFSFVDAPTPAEPMEAEPQEEERPGKSTDGSVKIHGHWVIEVKEKDGTVKDRREFENSYVGGLEMARLLAGYSVALPPAIFFGGNACPNYSGGTFSSGCFIVPSLSSGVGQYLSLESTYKEAQNGNAFGGITGACGGLPGCYSGLTSTLAPAGGPYTSLVLSGTIAAPGTGSSSQVGTLFAFCSTDYMPFVNKPTNVSPSSCNSNVAAYGNNGNNPVSTGPFLYGWYLFTSAPPPGGAITFNAGDILVFTVTISFV